MVRAEITDEARSALIPSFAVQTLVENAVRHGAAPRIEATEISISGRAEQGVLTVTVRDNGTGASTEQVGGSSGTGLKRLRERLSVLYGSEARLELVSNNGSGFSASLVIPYAPADA